MVEEHNAASRRWLGLCLFMSIMDALEGYYYVPPPSRRGRRCVRTSICQGINYVKELLSEKGPNVRCMEVLGVDKHDFHRILDYLTEAGLVIDRKYVFATEQLAIYLSMVHGGLSNRQSQERFQHSGWTISIVFHIAAGSTCRLLHSREGCTNGPCFGLFLSIVLVL